MAVLKPFADVYETPVLDPVPFRVRIRAPDSQIFDWHTDNGFAERVGSTPEEERAYRTMLEEALREDGVRAGYYPQGNKMSGVIASVKNFTRSMLLCSPDVTLFRAEVPCDGLVLPSRAAFVLDPGGCAVLVLTALTKGGEQLCIAAHAGLMSLIAIDADREHESVIDAMIAQAEGQFALAETLTLRAFYPLPWQGLPRWSKDPVHGAHNIRQLEYLRDHHLSRAIRVHLGKEYVDLARLIHEQARRAGIHNIETGLHILPVDGPYAYTSHSNPSLADRMRNLVTVVRLS